ncbi:MULTISPECIES: VOC family protein [Brenneria]|uniref:VOC family protein n=1 Tax=Brenneria nigrifluens DSM 30175 = ATCC 13028 TaxID=1121120 RepID=A0A2U1UVW0_9GAMM|nr:MULTISPECIES: VOC family protein [Brenneria]EHD22833.1 Glyoxalase/bleomycin resistance protein/dioxygenase [Brenneria sp. EniD312]PWC25815.1 VOC family protein [Brenneria nigrifluens] [Brenneria nigrifluens DSM 30175 = ATCC 13028]QCR05801.1 VOC family protein [Brenneria nigrifluens] [Brenneria nigrifluens DSM 30175 = ATCC 13028]
MLKLIDIHHIAIIASDYERSKAFYCDVLGFSLINEVYRAERDSWKGDLALNERYLIELFSFPAPPPRVSRPEACGLRHLAFAVEDVGQAIAALTQAGVECEPIRIDAETQRRFTFLRDPDGLPLELYER